MTEIPEAPRPKLAAYLAAHGLNVFEGAAMLGCSGEYVRLMCLPFGDPRRRDPSAKMRARISRATEGAVSVEDWSAPVTQAVAA